MAVKTE